MRGKVVARLAGSVLVVLLLVLAGCGVQPEASKLFTEENAWNDQVPPAATLISPEEFERLVRQGELTLRSSEAVLRQSQGRDETFASDRAYLASLAEPSDVVTELLATVGASTSFSGDVVVELDGDAIVLEGLGTTVTNLARAMRLAASAENAWAAYQLSFDLVPPTLQAALPTPASLSGKPLSQINAALQELEAQLATVANLAQTHAEATPAAPGPHELTAQSAGTGIDTDAACAAPSGYVASIWFPLKSFVSPVRNQSRRGTCWAFTAIGALESRELVQNGNAVNLSEQFLVNKVKNDWAEADYSEGYDAVTALNLAVANGQGLPSESSWTYNGAPNRTSNGDGAAADYVGTCNPYGQGPNAGWCSETAHQSPQYCTTVVFTFCGYKTIQFSGGIAASNASQIWASGQPFLKNNYINLLAQGQLIMASFPVYEGFMSAEKGIVTNYDKKRLDDKNNLVDGAYGNHAVQIVAFLSNQQLSTPSYAANVGGGGYFVVKNSWGCGAGDGGYWYVPADYVWRRFNSLSVLQMGSQRSAAWKREQADPGSAEAPTVGIKSANATIDLRVPTDLTNYFGVSHSVATSVQLTVASSKDGTLYSGAWNTAPYTFPVPLTRTFASAGARTITVTATYAGNVTRKSFTANVVNTAPALSLSGSGTAYVGDPYFLTALVSDINDSGTAGLCAATTWQVTAPDTLTPASGCQVTATFAAEGTRTVSATTRDADGLTSTRSLTLNVRPQSESPFPKVTAFGVYSRQFTSLGGLPFCSNVSVATGATIDFRQDGCVVTGPAPKRYSASVEVENPSNEALTYAWLTEVYYSGAWHAINSPAATPDATFVPYSIGNTGLTTAPCRIGVRVNAPEPTRSKSLTVWSGSCTYYTTRLN